MTYKLSNRSLKRLEGVHPDLQAVFKEAIKITKVDFIILEGLRTKERQRELYNRGASKTMNSRHLTGHAVDAAPYVDGAVSWHWPDYHQLAPYIRQAANRLGIRTNGQYPDLEWGGDWKSFPDGPHWQLSWAKYKA